MAAATCVTADGRYGSGGKLHYLALIRALCEGRGRGHTGGGGGGVGTGPPSGVNCLWRLNNNRDIPDVRHVITVYTHIKDAQL